MESSGDPHVWQQLPQLSILWACPISCPQFSAREIATALSRPKPRLVRSWKPRPPCAEMGPKYPPLSAAGAVLLLRTSLLLFKSGEDPRTG